MSIEQVIARSLWDASQSVPPQLLAHNGSDPAKRWAVYRNNVWVSLVDVLAQGFPVCQALVGETFFRAMAQCYVRDNPPSHPVLAWYGDRLDTYIGSFPPAAGLPYLPDMARLEYSRTCALHAEDATAMTADQMAVWLAQPERLSQLRWRLHPSLFCLRSAYGVASLWAAHQESSSQSIEQVDLEQAETAWVFRQDDHVVVWRPEPGALAFVEALQQGQCLEQSCAAATQEAAQFDLARTWADLLSNGLLLAAHLEDNTLL